ncbi:hypothetical protein QOT17_013787 [Balamuthia mandrillaris]
MDNLIIFSKTYENPLVYLCQVFEHLCEYQLYTKVNKCTFVKEMMEYLGHMCKVKMVQNCPFLPPGSNYKASLDLQTTITSSSIISLR